MGLTMGRWCDVHPIARLVCLVLRPALPCWASPVHLDDCERGARAVPRFPTYAGLLSPLCRLSRVVRLGSDTVGALWSLLASALSQDPGVGGWRYLADKRKMGHWWDIVKHGIVPRAVKGHPKSPNATDKSEAVVKHSEEHATGRRTLDLSPCEPLISPI